MRNKIWFFIKKYKLGFMIVFGIIGNLILTKSSGYIDYKTERKKNFVKYQDKAIIFLKKKDIERHI